MLTKGTQPEKQATTYQNLMNPLSKLSLVSAEVASTSSIYSILEIETKTTFINLTLSCLSIFLIQFHVLRDFFDKKCHLTILLLSHVFLLF